MVGGVHYAFALRITPYGVCRDAAGGRLYKGGFRPIASWGEVRRNVGGGCAMNVGCLGGRW